MTRTVLHLVGRFLIEHDGIQENVSERDITPAQADALRAEAAAQRGPRNVKRTRRQGRPTKFMHRKYSPADAIVAGDILGTNVNKI